MLPLKSYKYKYKYKYKYSGLRLFYSLRLQYGYTENYNSNMFIPSLALTALRQTCDNLSCVVMYTYTNMRQLFLCCHTSRRSSVGLKELNEHVVHS